MSFKPPKHLSPESKALWKLVVPRRGKSPERLALIEEALMARDRSAQARKELDAQSLTTKTETTGAIHLNPLLRVERENRQAFTRMWNQLGFDWDYKVDGRGFMKPVDWDE